jgi:cytochrome P450
VRTQGLYPGAGADVFARVGATRADPISELVRVHDGSDRLSIDELTATCRLILTAGHETTVNLIGNGTLALLGTSRRVTFWREIMTSRFAYELCHVGDKDVARGAMMLPLLGAANLEWRENVVLRGLRALHVTG